MVAAKTMASFSSPMILFSSLTIVVVTELVEGLTRAQRRLEDQRGTEINFELPDFLKDKEERHLLKQNSSDNPASQPKIALTKNLRQDNQSNYENQNILVKHMEKFGPVLEAKTNPEKVKTVLELGGVRVEPPPLPPKPKIVPIKPLNWGQSALCKSVIRDVPSTEKVKSDTFLEQTSSSFV